MNPTSIDDSQSWQLLADELGCWRALARTPTLWWRDDDAEQDSEALQRLCRLSRKFSIPLSLAVIPAGADESLKPLFQRTLGLQALQHGYSHQNHAPASKRKCELGDDRPLTDIVEQLSRGREHLTQLLGQAFVPALVPPWNRLSETLVDQLRPRHFVGLSTLGPRQAAIVSGLRLNHVHIDLINWREGRRFAGDAQVLGQLINHLRQRRLAEVDPQEATGLMSHHLAHDEGCWDFLERLFRFLEDQPVRWLTGAELFDPAS
ncbi:polysaccharide deacetylase family protein [Motiliproteus sp.]|uniref:polysaccharide deacetylase family protein n=1 Tax=Motiliproteus sp. TaxID=1898955 RepID=UPI003BAB5181